VGGGFFWGGGKGLCGLGGGKRNVQPDRFGLEKRLKIKNSGKVMEKSTETNKKKRVQGKKRTANLPSRAVEKYTEEPCTAV